MNPYLEQPAFWPSFHYRFMVAIANAIEPQLSDRYYIDVETRTYQSNDDGSEVLIGIPDAVVLRSEEGRPAVPNERLEASEPTISVALQDPPEPEMVRVPMPLEIRERYLEIREVGSDAVITVMELLSPKNKQAGEGRDAYEQKRRAVLSSSTHLIELDLLCGGRQMEILGTPRMTPYRILISRSHQRPTAQLYGISLQQPLPSIWIPLKAEEDEVIAPLQDAFEQVFREARYGTRIDYRQPPPPPALSKVDQVWVNERLVPLRG
ncbi:MAG: DUF4058 family protein [Oculatellaceae cyanobacterium Prado106]|jgi:hypothetical protein|nr:DUF4058 family protein [Oculatellaceae cyanobacterium Prado106]